MDGWTAFVLHIFNIYKLIGKSQVMQVTMVTVYRELNLKKSFVTKCHEEAHNFLSTGKIVPVLIITEVF